MKGLHSATERLRVQHRRLTVPAQACFTVPRQLADRIEQIATGSAQVARSLPDARLLDVVAGAARGAAHGCRRAARRWG